MRLLPISTLFLALYAVSLLAGCDRFQEAGLRKYALDLCNKLEHPSGASCSEEVKRNFPRCSPPFLAKKIGSDEFAECLGFALPPKRPPPTVLGECAPPHIKASVALYLAKVLPWEGSTRRVLDGEALFVSKTPTLGTGDLLSLRLQQGDGEPEIAVQISPAAARRLENATEDNVGNFMVLELNGSAFAMRIMEAIPTARLVIGAPDTSLEDVCNP